MPANYYSGTNYQMPTLKVTADNGSTIETDVATQTTAWQQLVVPITPTTTSGQITIEVTGYTDQTGSNAQFYVDDFSVILPAGVSVNTGTLDLWSRGLPVIPTIATTGNSALDVWEVPTIITAGDVDTMGEVLVLTKQYAESAEKKADDATVLSLT